MKTRLMIVDDHEVVRMGLKAALEIEHDFTVVAEAGNGKEAIDKARAHQPDIVLMDVRMDGMDGIEACREIRSEFPETRVLMLTSFAEEETVVAALLAGAAGYVLKNVARARLLEALRSVARGETLLDSKVTQGVLEKLVAGQGQSRARRRPHRRASAKSSSSSPKARPTRRSPRSSSSARTPPATTSATSSASSASAAAAKPPPTRCAKAS